jgi:ketosteroid isomerase-like protein
MNFLKQTTFYLLAILILLVFTSCSSNSIQEAEFEIDKLWSEFEVNWNQMNSTETVSIYAEDAVLIPASMVELSGKSSIENFYGSLFSSNRSANYTHTTQSLDVWKESAVESGVFEVEWITNEGEEWTFSARVMIHWERINDEWKIRRLMFNQPPE